MKRFRRPGDATPTGIDVAMGAMVIVAALLLATRIPRADLTWRCAVITMVLGGFATFVGDAPAVAFLVPTTWMLMNGFMENTLGQLSWHGAADVHLLTALGLAGCLGLAGGHLGRRQRSIGNEVAPNTVVSLGESRRVRARE